MRPYGVLVLLLVAMMGWGKGLPPRQEEKWQPRQGEGGVQLWVRAHPPGSFLSLRLEMRVKAEPAALLTVLRDTARHREWLPKSREVKVWARSGTDDELVYTLLESPWPVQDRELITRSHVSRHADCGLALKVWAEPDALRERPGLVRIRVSQGRWEALPQTDGTTLVRLETYTDPGTSLPGWLVNPMTIKAALESFQAIRRLMEADPGARQPNLFGTSKRCVATP